MPPPVNASNLNDISNALESLNITQQEAENIGGTVDMSLGEMLQQMNADTINLFAPYTTNYKWERYNQTVGISQSETSNTLSIMATTNPATIQYCTLFTVVNGVVQMNNPTSITWPTTTTCMYMHQQSAVTSEPLLSKPFQHRLVICKYMDHNARYKLCVSPEHGLLHLISTHIQQTDIKVITIISALRQITCGISIQKL